MQKTTAELAAFLGGKLEGDPKVLITGASLLEDAEPGHVSFLANARYLPLLRRTRASAVLIHPGAERPVATNYILVDNPSLAFARLMEIVIPPQPRPAEGIAPNALIHPEARIHATASIGPFCVIEAGVSIGARSIVGAQCFIGSETKLGEDCRLYPQVVLRERVTIGNRVILHPGVVVGADGFGFEPGPNGLEKIPQIGTVQIDDDVEIGANSTVDRGRLGKTHIRRGVKLDNLVQVAHNCVIGENTAIAALSGVGGSTKIGKNVLVGGQAGFSGHTAIGDGARIGAQSGVHTNVAAGEDYFGYPAQPADKARKGYANIQRIPYLQKRIKQLEEEVKRLKKE